MLFGRHVPCPLFDFTGIIDTGGFGFFDVLSDGAFACLIFSAAFGFFFFMLLAWLLIRCLKVAYTSSDSTVFLTRSGQSRGTWNEMA
jgi:hypothetical protein